MVRNEERVAHVKQLRSFARTAGVALAREDASRAAVFDMVSRVRASGPPAATLLKLEKEFKLCERTFPPHADLEDAAGNEDEDEDNNDDDEEEEDAQEDTLEEEEEEG